MPVRRIVHHPKYDKLVEELSTKYPRLPEILVGAEWSIVRSPESDGIRATENEIWRARISGPGLPEHWIYYNFDAREVRFLTVTPVD